VIFARPQPHRSGRALLFKRKVAAKGRLARSAGAGLPSQPDVAAPPCIFIVSIVLGIAFPLIPIVLAPTLFLSFSQGLALQTGRFFHCRSPVFLFWQLVVEIELYGALAFIRPTPRPKAQH
jgi:hypothetical protein